MEKGKKMINTTYFDDSYVKPLLDKYKGNEIFEKKVTETGSADGVQLLSVLARYVKFNEPFAAGAVVLAGNLAARGDIFRTIGGSLFSDKSYEVARHVYSATCDEFGQGKHRKSPHRELAKSMLRGAGAFYNYTPSSMESFVDISGPTCAAVEKVRQGYGLNRIVADKDLFTGIGHHIASESLADDEFYRLNRALRANHSSLVSRLEQDHEYYWIDVHGGKEAEHAGVEMDHYQAALKAADLSLFYYSGEISTDELRHLVLKGFRNFMELHLDFMRHIAD